jgi:hypothetical protein
MLASRANHLDADAWMLLDDLIHRIHIQQLQPRSGQGRRADDVPSSTECRCNAENVSRPLENLQYLLTPLGIHAKKFHSTRLQDEEIPTRVSFHEHRLTGVQCFRLATGSDSL